MKETLWFCGTEDYYPYGLQFCGNPIKYDSIFSMVPITYDGGPIGPLHRSTNNPAYIDWGMKVFHRTYDTDGIEISDGVTAIVRIPYEPAGDPFRIDKLQANVSWNFTTPLSLNLDDCIWMRFYVREEGEVDWKDPYWGSPLWGWGCPLKSTEIQSSFPLAESLLPVPWKVYYVFHVATIPGSFLIEMYSGNDPDLPYDHSYIDNIHFRYKRLKGVLKHK